MPRVSVVVPVHEVGPRLGRCLSALGALAPAPFEVIVVCDGPSGAVKASLSGLRVVELRDRLGPARARNAGARLASGEVLLFLDSDVEAPTDLVGRVALALSREPGVAAVIGSYDDAPAEPDFLSQYRNLLHHYVHQTSSRDAQTFWGACGAIRRSIFARMRGFDESYLEPSIEDIELGYRLVSAGHAIRLDATLQVKHLKRWTAGRLLATDFFRRALPWSKLILSRRWLVNDLNLRTSARVTSVALYGALACGGGALLRPEAALLALPLLLLALWLNAGFYRFLARKRGLPFALRAVPWHWLYFASSGLAFACAAAGHALRLARRGRRSGAGREA